MLLLLSACGASQARDAKPSPNGHLSPTTLCFTDLAPDWAAAGSQVVVNLPGVNFAPTAIDETAGIVFGSFATTSEQGVAAVDLSSGKLTKISVMTATASGVIWMSYTEPWLVWAQGESQYLMGNWTIQAWNRLTAEKLELGSSRLPDGAYLENELAFPVVGHGFAGWNQPTSKTSADLAVFRLSSRQYTVLDSGKLSSPVFAGRYLVWAKFAGNDDQPSLQFADAETLQKVGGPAELQGSRSVNYLAGSSDYLLWIAFGSAGADEQMTVDELGRGRLSHYVSDGRHFLQFPMIAGHFLVWYAPSGNSVVDLHTGYGFDLAQTGGVVAAGDTIVATTHAPGPKGAITSTAISVLHPSKLSTIAACP